jgi:hypothetical protein
MAEPLAIDLDDIRAALMGVLDACEEQLGRHVVVDLDYYWHLPVDSAFDMSRKPTEVTVGQLSDDLSEMSATRPEALTTWHDLAHIIGLLRALEKLARP